MSERNNSVPIFTPPTDAAPVFKPPRNNGHAGCYFHPDEPAVGNCARCGKPLCEDCHEAYGVSGGEYADQTLCYDCTRELVAQNVADLTANKKKIKSQFILSIVGIVIGFIVGLLAGLSEGFGTALITAVIGAGIGGVFLTFIKFYFSLLWQAFKALFANLGNGAGLIGALLGIFISLFIGVLKCIYLTFRNTIDYISYLKRTEGFIESDSAALHQMEEYMEYTRVRNQNKGVDLETLMAQGSELYNNSFAQLVRERGEEAATEEIARATTRIAANGEIIRDFAA